ncbi:saxitoxin and tetrodotoxin-binding protein 2-like [Mastacembelus armatus]|uniref:saxitoxin and tetrodotoxin-binding protein 2-like n=1 Tax=Mastacembelus armatus TaxID=205130 RepID=UPI000E45EB77|nr:saxitoxin and tetrodotoxin-binding protein 2-like [Mastacembelus armatus]
MCFQSRVFVVTLLLLSLTAAAPTQDECAHMNTTLSSEDLPMIFGKWILHEAYVSPSHSYYSLRLENITSSKTEFIPLDNNQTVNFKQEHMKGITCSRYSVNFTVVGNTIQYTAASRNSTFKIDFLKSCDDCLVIRYSVKGTWEEATYLLFYKKTEKMADTDQERVRQQAKCLGFQEPPQFSYKQAELCPQESDATQDKAPEQ